MHRAKARDHVTGSAVVVERVRVTPATAARMLDVHYETVRDLITKRVFTVIAPNGRGPGKRYFLLADEVQVYGETGDELAVRELRAQKGRLPDERSRRRR